MKVGIIGCGLIGQKRARALAGAKLVACADVVPQRAQALAAQHSGAQAFGDWQSVVDQKEIGVVIVATTNDKLAEITRAALLQGKSVLVEKPAGRRSAELEPLVEASRAHGGLVRVGFNHRYHPSFRKARELFEAGAIGDPLYVRARYGHGGRLGYEKEWRAIPGIAGGGELLDQGVHLIDLSLWFLGRLVSLQSSMHTYFWNMPVEDNAFLLLEAENKRTAFLHASCTEWKNLFSFELFGQTGKLEVSGLGGSYGVERLSYYRMLPQMGPPETTIWEYPMADNSWDVEFTEFLEDVRLERTPAAGLSEAIEALRAVEQVYRTHGQTI